MRTALRVSTETLTAVVYIASFAVVAGAFATIYAKSLRTGLLIAAELSSLEPWASFTVCGGSTARDGRSALER